MRQNAATALDSMVERETPEGVVLTLAPAGITPRALALIIDIIVVQMISLLVFLPLSLLGEAGYGLYLVVAFLGQWFYPVFCEVLNQGQTLGKYVMGVRTVHDDGTPVGWPASVTRNLVMFVDMLPLTYLFGAVCVVCSRDFKRIGDHVAGTLVVHVPLTVQATLEVDIGTRGLSVPLTNAEQALIVEYAERVPNLTAARAEEIGDELAVLTGATGAEGRRRLLQLANGIVGS